MVKKWAWCPMLILLVGFVLVSGCSGPEVGEVTGSVSVNGQPLTTGSVMFCNTETGNSINANINSDGTYTVKTYESKGIPPGEYQVAVKSCSLSTGQPVRVDEMLKAQKRPMALIPPKYQSIVTSGLTATVKNGKNAPFQFDLK